MLETSPKTRSVGQGEILDAIRRYLTYSLSSEKDQEAVRAVLGSKLEGHCSGISALWLYSKWQQKLKSDTAKQQRGQQQITPSLSTSVAVDDYQWFESTRNLILNWSIPPGDIASQIPGLKERVAARMSREKGTHSPGLYKQYLDEELRELEKTIGTEKVTKVKQLMDNNEQIERFISLIDYFQLIYLRQPGIAQGELDKFVQDTKGRVPNKEYSIGSMFTLQQLKDFLKRPDIIQDGRLILVQVCKFDYLHATAIFRDGDNYYYFDPNSLTGEVQTVSLEKLAELVFKTLNYIDDVPSPVGFRMFSLDGKKPPFPYPSQQEVLDAISPSLGKYYEWTGLMIAALINSVESVEYFLRQGIDPNVKTAVNGFTALMVAANSGNTEVVKFLLQQKIQRIDFEAKGSNDGNNALMLAIQRGNAEVVEALLTTEMFNLDAINNDGNNALMLAIQCGNAEVVMILLKKIDRFKLDAINNDGNSALMLAARHGNHEVIEILSRSPAFVNPMVKKPPQIMEAIIVAASRKDVATVKALLEQIKLEDVKDQRGWIALIWAIKCGGVEIIGDLLKKLNPEDAVALHVLLMVYKNAGSESSTIVGELLPYISLAELKHLRDIKPPDALYEDVVKWFVKKYHDTGKLSDKDLTCFMEFYSNIERENYFMMLQSIEAGDLLKIISFYVGSYTRPMSSLFFAKPAKFDCKRLKELKEENYPGFIYMLNRIFSVNEILPYKKTELVAKLFEIEELFNDEYKDDPVVKSIQDALFWAMYDYSGPVHVGVSYNLDKLKNALEEVVRKGAVASPTEKSIIDQVKTALEVTTGKQEKVLDTDVSSSSVPMP